MPYWSFAVGKTPILKIGMDADFKEGFFIYHQNKGKTNMKKITIVLGGMDATVTNKEVFAKQKLQRTKLAWMLILFALALIALSMTGCGGSDPNPKTFTVTFDANNGSAKTTQTVTEGAKAVKPADPTKDGYTFDYWFNVADNAQWDFETIISADLNLKAKWNETPKAQSTTQTITFETGVSYDVTYQGTFTDTEWTDIVANIETAFITSYNSITGPGGVGNKNATETIFGDGVTIIVEKNPDYANYKIIAGEYRTLYLNVVSDLTPTVIQKAIAAMINENGTDLIGQTTPVMMKNTIIIKCA